MLTQKELAQKLGVSQQAVSFALNGGGTLKQATREHIIEQAQKAGYRVNMASRLFREGKTGSIALIVHGNFHSLSGIMLSGMRLVLREHDIHLTLFGAEDDDFADPKNPQRLVRELSVDGFLVLYDDRATKLTEQIANYRIPSVWINQKQAENAVYPDDFGITVRAVRELAALKQGHILYYGPPKRPGSHYSVGDRHDGFLRGLEKVGRSGEVVDASMAPADPDSKHAEIRAILQRKRQQPKIILTYGVEDAEAFIIQAARLGLKIPEDLIVCCFSLQRAQVAHYKMTRIFVPIHIVGIEATKMLLKRIESPGRSFPSIAVDEFIIHHEPEPTGFYL